MQLIYTIKEIQYLKEHFKNYSNMSEREFLTDEITHLLEKAPAMYDGYLASYKKDKYLQPGYLTEINVCATLAKMLNLTYDKNANEKNLRHQYSNNDNTFLKQYGGCGMSDIKLITEHVSVTIEVKEPLSLGGDYDLGITEEGKLFPKIAAGREFPEAAQNILNDFNATDSIFNHLGHNIPLSNIEYLKTILNSYLGDKHIDYIATYCKNSNELIYFPANDIYNHVDFQGSEIRTAGKNSVKVYTPIAFYTALINIGCLIDADNVVSIPKDTISFRRSRGSNNQISGIKINPIFYFKIEDILKEDDNYYYAHINKGMQLKQGIGVHLNLK